MLNAAIQAVRYMLPMPSMAARARNATSMSSVVKRLML